MLSAPLSPTAKTLREGRSVDASEYSDLPSVDAV